MADVGDQVPSHDSPTTPFRKIVLPSEETVQIPRPPAQRLPAPQTPEPQAPESRAPKPQTPESQTPERPPPGSALSSLPPIPEPPKRGIGDIPMKVVYLVAAIIGTVLAVFLIFMLFSGDVPANKKAAERSASVAPAPASASSVAPPAPSGTVSPIALPPAPASRKYPTLSGTASVVIGIVSDKDTGISYPRLAAPWKAKSVQPFSIAQRIGKVAVPPTVIASAMFPGDSPAKKPSKDADYRRLAVEAARWAVATQYPQGATLAWTASGKIPVGTGWTLGYQVTYPAGGEQQVAQGMVTVVEVGRTKPAMLLASIPETHKKHWRDINTLVERVRPL
ncbi:hypothetical protein [Nonomuraea sp. NPDC050786]|uniref:hypothetical protein n=1 Tax=Nonomuraea sp. NPDC050786 TaxID=3154840 RepID=UPI0033CAB7EA